MQKLKMHSADHTAQNLAQLQTLFPHCFTEGKIDFELLQQELSSYLLDGSQERYQLNWVGKREALLAANAPIAKTLRPVPSESVNFDTTENLFIEGDNLDALKLLQETYLGKVKMIYIDPPYNTGNDFVYKDNFAETQSDFLTRSNQIDEQGNRLVSNSESNGRFHSDWLSMIYPRLKLARNLLADDGVIFISIDDNEQANLKRVCDEIFGEENFIAQISWRRTDNQSNIGNFARVKEYIFCYARNIQEVKLGRLSLSETALKEYRYSDEKGKFRRNILFHKTRGRHYYEVKTNSGKILTGPWMLKESEFKKLDEQGLIYWTTGGDEQPYGKLYLDESKGQIPNDFWGIEFGSNQRGSLEVEALFDARYFDFPKPTILIKNLLNLGVEKNDLILDFFAGSATTAHAVMQLNAEDGGNRKFIMVQLPEKTDPKSEAYKAGFATIAEISKERIRRAGAKIKAENADVDVGFRVLKVDSSNLADVYYSPEKLTQNDLFSLENPIKADRSDEDLLFQTMLDLGIALSSPIERLTVQGRRVFNVADKQLIACFEAIDEVLITELAELRPEQAVFLDAKFANDSVRINAEQIFKQISPSSALSVI